MAIVSEFFMQTIPSNYCYTTAVDLFHRVSKANVTEGALFEACVKISAIAQRTVMAALRTEALHATGKTPVKFFSN